MTLEATLLLILSFFLMLGLATKPRGTFRESGPRLGARLENEIAVGSRFNSGPQRQPNKWHTPQGAPPTGEF